MLDRGLRRALRPAGRARGARRGRARAGGDAAERATCASCRRSPSTRRRRGTSTTRSRPSGSTAADGACGSTSPTSPRSCRPARPVDREAYRRATSVYVPGSVEPMLPEALSNDACSLVPGTRTGCAVTVEMDFDGAEVVRSRVPPLADPLRRAAGLRRGGPDLRRRGARARRRGREPLAAARGRRGGARCGARARAARWWSSRPSRSSTSTATATCRGAPTAQTESHRLIEHLMIAANEQVADAARDAQVPALYRVHERPDPQRVRAPGRPARLARRADAAGARALVAASRRRRSSRETSRLVDAARARAPGTAGRR